MDSSRIDNTKALPPERLRLKRKIKLALKWVLASIFVVSGGYHFWRLGFDPEFDLWVLPWPYAVIYLSGGLELMLGIMLFFRTMQIIAAWTLIVLLISVAPAHIYFVVNSDWDLEAGTLFVVARLAFHFLLIAWTFWYTRSSRRSSVLAKGAAKPVKARASKVATAEPAVADTAATAEPAVMDTATAQRAVVDTAMAESAVADTASVQEIEGRAAERPEAVDSEIAKRDARIADLEAKLERVLQMAEEKSSDGRVEIEGVKPKNKGGRSRNRAKDSGTGS